MLIGFGWWIHIWDGDFQGLTLCLGRTAVHGSRTPEGDFLGFSKSNGLSQGSSGWWFQTFCFFFHNIWDVILPIDELHHFSRWIKPPTSH